MGTRVADHREKSSAVYTQYKSWVALNGIKHAVTHKTFDDVKHYQRILKILSETARIMATITMTLDTVAVAD